MYVINFLLSVIPLELNFINVKKSTIRDLEEILIYEKRNK